jgi:hypothetical protein
VTYTVTAALMAMMEVDRRGQDTATVVIAVGVGDINFDRLDQPATKRLVHSWYGLRYHLRIYHQCCHPLHS